MPPLSDEEIEEFLHSTDQEPWGRCIAELATLTPGGKPYLNPVWYEWEDGNVYIIGKPKAQYVDNIKNNEYVFVVIDKQSPPYKRVNIRGQAEVVSEEWTDRWEQMAREMTDAYLGEEGLEYHEERLEYGISAIEVTIGSMNTWKVTDFPPDRTFEEEASWREADE
jgi:nitroimidazol reductase NimA-like FMN-containing flavoprotein (pyridoxamine 5'-phosphate oxidase superfamily)